MPSQMAGLLSPPAGSQLQFQRNQMIQRQMSMPGELKISTSKGLKEGKGNTGFTSREKPGKR